MSLFPLLFVNLQASIWTFLQRKLGFWAPLFVSTCGKNEVHRGFCGGLKWINRREKLTSAWLASCFLHFETWFTLFCLISLSDVRGSWGCTWVSKAGLPFCLERSTNREGKGKISAPFSPKFMNKYILKPYFFWKTAL